MKIDLVYLWVNGADSAWRERRRPYLSREDQSDEDAFCEGRIIDNDELRYSLRSVEMYAPWINHIFIVTDNQCPEWLDVSNPKITIVDHKDILPAEVLPLYSSTAIEHGIHNIKGLSEHFLYANDDTMFGRFVSPSFFFTADGKARCRFIRTKRLSKPNALNNTYNYNIKQVVDTIIADFGLKCNDWTPNHQIDAYTKSSISKCLEKYSEWSQRTLNSRFRSYEDMQRYIFSLYAVATGEAEAIVRKRANRLTPNSLIPSLLGTRRVKSLYLAINKKNIRSKIKQLKPALLCLNDVPQATDEDRVEMRRLLKKLYPKKSQFELGEGEFIDKIDLVYLWVNGDDPEWIERRLSYLSSESDKMVRANRTIDNEGLRYSLRSVERYAPWVNHIYIVTDTQPPTWLDTSNPMITIVNHTEILPADALPTYNSCAIEQCVHLIKGLSEHFILANDDMLFCRSTSPDFFFTADGLSRHRFDLTKRFSKVKSPLSAHINTIKEANDSINSDLGLECCDWVPNLQMNPYTKSSITKCIDAYKEWSDATIYGRFCSRDDMQRHIFSLFATATGEGEAIVTRRAGKLRRAGQKLAILLGLKRGNPSLSLSIKRKRLKTKINNYKPALLCLNDSQGATAEDKDRMNELLKELFPAKSTFER